MNNNIHQLLIMISLERPSKFKAVEGLLQNLQAPNKLLTTFESNFLHFTNNENISVTFFKLPVNQMSLSY